ncbi:hypothetical protein [Acinetobacter gyllenbergii]|uniref:hypothetical protein n=1 Tax=Acinetobacter gyllenbergii TaxID=134534 RepID=UPI0003BE649B|nr:hypothetical protein [Acinetobacter gyllenbergii]ESK42112.1 hypothetical protein F987_02133 [Acinetobacter gyllenbergii NIPH 230]
MIKQTQTKYFDFSDVGLDFCAGSKNKFPEVFKKMLATGFNPQTATSVSSTDTQVILNFGVNHGYVADRVLQVSASGGYNKQVYIDSVTANTVTFTESVTTGLTGTITTKIASLGWEIVYEVNNVHIYKFKSLDESDLFFRICFQPNGSSASNYAHPCVGRSANLSTGIIDDQYAFTATKDITTPVTTANVSRWTFANSTATHNNYTYSQGFASFGKGSVIGSPYHLAFLCNSFSATGYGQISAILPFSSLSYENIQLPIVIGNENAAGLASPSSFRMYAGNIELSLQSAGLGIQNKYSTQAQNSFLPASIDNFNTTVAKLIQCREVNTLQTLGYCSGGAYVCEYATSNNPSKSFTESPSQTTDIDFNNFVYIHFVSGTAAASGDTLYMAFPIEEIKIGA